MKKYLVKRIKQNQNCPFVIKNTMPIPFFGNIENAKVATLGLNPSKNEFILNSSELIKGNRFETLSSLGSNNYDALTEEQIQIVYKTCLNYFSNNPYNKWFDILNDYILKKLNVSYSDQTACHLDLVQWATDPIWRKIDKQSKIDLIEKDIEFLHEQLLNEDIQILLLNGKGATNVFVEYFKPNLIKKEKIELEKRSCNLYIYNLDLGVKSIKIYAWSQNLQSSIGITNNMREAIGNWVKENSK